MLPIARLTDMFAGICCCHCCPTCIGMTGNIITASPNVITNNLGTARIGDIVLGGCGHTGVIVTGSSNININNMNSGHLTSFVVGCLIGHIVTGSPNTNIS